MSCPRSVAGKKDKYFEGGMNGLYKRHVVSFLFSVFIQSQRGIRMVKKREERKEAYFQFGKFCFLLLLLLTKLLQQHLDFYVVKFLAGEDLALIWIISNIQAKMSSCIIFLGLVYTSLKGTCFQQCN